MSEECCAAIGTIAGICLVLAWPIGGECLVFVAMLIVMVAVIGWKLK